MGSQNLVGPNRDSQLDHILRVVTKSQRQNAEALAEVQRQCSVELADLRGQIMQLVESC